MALDTRSRWGRRGPRAARAALAALALAAGPAGVGPSAAAQDASAVRAATPVAATPVAAWPGAPAVRLPSGTHQLRSADLATRPRRLPETPAGRLEAAFVTPLRDAVTAPTPTSWAPPGAEAVLRAFEAAGFRVAWRRPKGAGPSGPPARALVVDPERGERRWLAFEPRPGALAWWAVRPAGGGP